MRLSPHGALCMLCKRKQKRYEQESTQRTEIMWAIVILWWVDLGEGRFWCFENLELLGALIYIQIMMHCEFDQFCKKWGFDLNSNFDACLELFRNSHVWFVLQFYYATKIQNNKFSVNFLICANIWCKFKHRNIIGNQHTRSEMMNWDDKVELHTPQNFKAEILNDSKALSWPWRSIKR